MCHCYSVVSLPLFCSILRLFRLCMTVLQIVSNRARSICYGVRQQHFRARAERTVNLLMTSSEQQLHTLATISHTQQQLMSMADSTMEQLETGRQQIADDQQQLRQAHRSMNSHVLRNLQHIQQEKEVIIASNKQLITNTKQIQQKLENTGEQINEQAKVQFARHKELLSDLAELDTQAKDISSKLDVSMTAVYKFERNVLEHQQDAIENLKQINDTVKFLLSLLNSVRDVMESKLEWIIHVTGITDIRMAVVSVIAVHISYAVVALILSMLLRVTWHICYLLLTLVLLNAAVELKFSSGLGCTQLAAVTLAVGIVASFIPRWWAIVFHRSLPVEPATEEQRLADSAKYHQILSSEDIKDVITALEQLSADFRRSISTDSCEEETMASVRIASSTPIRRHLPQPHLDSIASSNSNKTASGSLLDCTPPPITRHGLPLTPRNPPPTPVVTGSSGILRLPVLESLPVLGSGDGSRPGSPVGSVSNSGTPRTALRRKSRNSSLNRSFNRSACTALTKSGGACKLPSQENSAFCHRHQFN